MKNILILGVIVILGAYLLFYTPLAESIFVRASSPKKAEIPARSSPANRVTSAEAISRVISSPGSGTGEPMAQNKSGSTKEAEAPKFVALRDPFEVGFEYRKAEVSPPLPGTPAEVKPAVVKKYLVLQGVFIAGETKMAIIDDRVVYEGSMVAGGYTVSQIREDRVVINKGDKIKTLRLK